MLSVIEAFFIVTSWIGIFLKAHFEPILSFLGLCISYIILKSTIKAINEQNRPFISFSIESVKKIGNLFIIIRNTGNRTAYNLKISTSPKLISVCSQNRKIPLIMSSDGEINLSGVAPNQVIQSFFDSGLYRYKENTEESVDLVEIVISYTYKKREFIEKTTIDFSYLKNASSISSPEDIDKNIKKIADNLEKIERKLK